MLTVIALGLLFLVGLRAGLGLATMGRAPGRARIRLLMDVCLCSQTWAAQAASAEPPPAQRTKSPTAPPASPAQQSPQTEAVRPVRPTSPKAPSAEQKTPHAPPTRAVLVKQRWALPVGKIPWFNNQLAVRGRLIAVAAERSVQVIDGKDGVALLVNELPAGMRPLGVALDATGFVYASTPADSPSSQGATSSGASTVTRLELDGTAQWAAPMGESVLSFPVLVRGTGPSTLDEPANVAVAIGGVETSIALLDGKSGFERWRTPLGSSCTAARLYALSPLALLAWCDGKFSLLDEGGRITARRSNSDFTAPPLLVRGDGSGLSGVFAVGETGGSARVYRLSELLPESPDDGERKVPARAVITSLSGPIDNQCLLIRRGEEIACVRQGGPMADGVIELYGRTAPNVQAFSFTRDTSSFRAVDTLSLIVEEGGTLTQATWSGDTLKLEEQVLGEAIGSAVIGNPARGTHWELIASVDDKLVAYETNVSGRAIRRMPLGDLAGTGIESDTSELPLEEAEEPADTALIESRDARGGSEFERVTVAPSDEMRARAATWSSRLMDTQMCFVVLGMDPDTVQRCVEVRYKSLMERMPQRSNFGEQFLEKLVTIAVRVPPVAADEIPEEVEPKKDPWWERALRFASARVDQVPGKHCRRARDRRRRVLDTLLSQRSAGAPEAVAILAHRDFSRVGGQRRALGSPRADAVSEREQREQ